jgi:hypothetical protein
MRNFDMTRPFACLPACLLLVLAPDGCNVGDTKQGLCGFIGSARVWPPPGMDAYGDLTDMFVRSRKPRTSREGGCHAHKYPARVQGRAT